VHSAGLAALRPTSRRTRIGAACGALATVALVIGIIVGAAPDASRGASPAAKPSGAATVQRRDLVSTDTESGTLTYANPQTVFNRLSGTVTWLPQVGQLIKAGQALYDVDNQPVVLFNGTTPAYRDLSSSDTAGPDILELNTDLKQMGFDSSDEISVNDTWQTGTTNAVEAWQNSLGETETGTISLGQVVFLPGTQRIASVSTVLGSTGGAGAASSSAGSGAGSGASSGSSSGTGSGSSTAGTYGPHTEFVSLTMTTNHPAAVIAKAASIASVKAAWDEACAEHNLARLTALKRRHQRLLASVRTAVCKPKAAAVTQAVPSADQAPADTTTATAAPTASSAPTGSVAVNTVATTVAKNAEPVATPSGLTPTWSADMATKGPHPSKPPGSSGTGSTGNGSFGSGGSASSEDKQINKALAALLRAETLLLERSSGSSSSRGGSSASSTSGARQSTAGGSASASSSRISGGAASSSSGGGASSSGSGASGSGSSASSGSASAQAILGTTSNQLDVLVDLDATKQSEAVVGEPVSVEMPDGSTVDGKIRQVSPVAQSTSSSSSSSSGAGGSSGTPSATIPVTISLHGKIPSSGLDQAAVSVNFEQQVANDVLSVPVTALLATQGGGYAVQEAAAPHKLIPVTVGLFAAGYVQISGAQIYPGLQVTDSQG
jgi:hypothetical protein